MIGIEEPTSVQGSVEVTTIDVEHLTDHGSYTKETIERRLWRAANSTGTALFATDIELIMQPLALLRNVSKCQIYLNPRLQEKMPLMELVAYYKKIIESKEQQILEDLKFVHETSEDLYRLARSIHGQSFSGLRPTEQERMEDLLWQTRRWHSMRAAPGRQR